MRSLSFRLVSLTAAGVVSLAACVSDPGVDPGEGVDDLPATDGPTIEFDPSSSIVPFPNNLLIDRMTGLVNLPEGCNESPAAAALRVGVLNSLNGFGTFKAALSVTFTEPVDPASLSGNVLLYKRATGATPVDPAAATAIPVIAIPGQTGRNSADCMSTTLVDNAVFVPLVPLEGGSTYTVALVGAINTMGGQPFISSATWALISAAENPVTIDEAGDIVADKTPFDPIEDRATLEGLDLLWKAHAQALGFLVATGQSRDDIHLAWEFNTQTTTDVLNPAVDGSLGAQAPSMPIAGVTSLVPGGATAEQFLQGALGAATCAAVGCAAVGDVVAGAVVAPQYQTLVDNPLAGGDPIPGVWADPIAPNSQGPEPILAISFIPIMPMPANGYPTVVFGHGLTRSKQDLFAVGSQLAAAGFISISIDWVAHSDRAKQVSDAGPCAGTPDPSALPQCFAPILSTDLAATRDNLRQSVLDGLALIGSLKVCDGAACGPIVVDDTRLGYLSQSLGSIIGAMIVSMSPDLRAAVLNVGGVGLVDVIENTNSLGIRCPVIDGLIAAGIISGEPLDLTTVPPTGTCLGEDWKMDPGYRRFAVIARWALDPGDGANFTPLLATRKVLIQEVIDDTVVPNFATDQMGALIGLTPAPADVSSDFSTVTASLAANPTVNTWLTYTSNATNLYSHGSVLAPAAPPGELPGLPGQLATALMQSDAITFLIANTQPAPAAQ